MGQILIVAATLIVLWHSTRPRMPRPSALPSLIAPSARRQSAFYVTKEAGYCSKSTGLFVDPVYVASGTKVAQAMIAGEFPIALAGGTFVNANLAGGDIADVRWTAVNVPSFYMWYVHPSIKRPEEMRGKDRRHHDLRVFHGLLDPLSGQETRAWSRTAT
jgi:ABC-type nitrate/sulfonate/bicarbonate transport system substrate-binding protein